MSEPALVLESFVFQDFEVPTGVRFGGRQLLAIHQLTDGRRIIDSIGPDESEISFSGAFSGADAAFRARTLNSLRTAGNELALTWDVFFYTVILREFEADYENPVWIPYRVACTVVRDESLTITSPTLSIGNGILADIGLAASQCAGLGLDLTVTQTCLNDPNATILGTAAYLAAGLQLARTTSAIDSYIEDTETILQTAMPPNGSPAESLMVGLNTSTLAAQQLACLTSANSYVGRASRNLSRAST
jgi:hypothetical protein